MGHDHGAGHHHGVSGHAGARHRWRLACALALVGGFFVVELVTGLVSGSLALISDAGHMGADVVSLGAALTATTIAARPDTTGRRTFGLYRAEVFASGLAVLLMLGVSVYILIEAIIRLGSPTKVAGEPMLVVGLLGLVVNIGALLLLRGGAEESLNIKGAYLEVVADALGSVGVLVAGALVAWTANPVWDSAIAIAISVFVAVRAWMLGKDVLAVLGQEAPHGVEPHAVTRALLEVSGVGEVHDLHLWQLTSGMNVATAHLVTVPDADAHDVLDRAADLLRHEFAIEHATLQVEPPDHVGCEDVAW